MIINARYPRNFFTPRMARDEIREMAIMMDKLIENENLDFLFEDIGFKP